MVGLQKEIILSYNILKRLEGTSTLTYPLIFFCSRLLIEGVHDSRGTVVAEGTEPVVAFGFGCPVENALAVAVGLMAGGIDEAFHESFAVHGAVGIIARLHNHQRRVVFFVEGVDVGDGAL